MARNRRRCKIDWRLRASRVKMIEPELKEQALEQNKALKLGAQGFQYRSEKKPNAFLNPEDPNAVFYQKLPQKLRDFRSIANPFAGQEMRGHMRKSKAKDVLMVKNYMLEGDQDWEQEFLDEAPQQNSYEQKQMFQKLLDMKIHDSVNKMKLNKKLSKDSKFKKGRVQSKKQMKF